MRSGAGQPHAVHVDIGLLVVEGDQARDGQQLAGGKVVGPGEILVAVAHFITGAHRPVGAGDALVRAGRLGAGGHEMTEVDIGAIEVVAGRQAGLEHQHRRGTLGERDPLQRDPDTPVRAKCVDADVRVSGMDEDLLLLLIPGIQRVPVETSSAGHPADRFVAEDTHASRAVFAAGPQSVPACRPLADALLVVLIHEETLIDVLDRDVVLGVERPFPHVPRPRAVEDQLAAKRRPHPPWRGFGMAGLHDHLRIVAIGRNR